MKFLFLILFCFNVAICQSTMQKLKWSYDWIVNTYKFENYKHNERDLNKIIEDSGTTCGGFAYLFSSICNGFKIKNEIVVGMWMYNEKDKNKLDKHEDFHVWNAVNINGKWYFVDCTLGILEKKKGIHLDKFFMMREENLFDFYVPKEKKWYKLMK